MPPLGACTTPAPYITHPAPYITHPAAAPYITRPAPYITRPSPYITRPSMSPLHYTPFNEPPSLHSDAYLVMVSAQCTSVLKECRGDCCINPLSADLPLVIAFLWWRLACSSTTHCHWTLAGYTISHTVLLHSSYSVNFTLCSQVDCFETPKVDLLNPPPTEVDLLNPSPTEVDLLNPHQQKWMYWTPHQQKWIYWRQKWTYWTPTPPPNTYFVVLDIININFYVIHTISALCLY